MNSSVYPTIFDCQFLPRPVDMMCFMRGLFKSQNILEDLETANRPTRLDYATSKYLNGGHIWKILVYVDDN